MFPRRGERLSVTSKNNEEIINSVDLRAQYRSIREEIRAAIDEVLESQHFILGPQVQGLEVEIARYCGTKFAVGVASGTDALILALRASGIGPDDEVLVPSFTYIATADSVSLLGARPVFVDIEPETYTIDPARLEAKVNPQTRAIIPVHLYGQSANMAPILELAQKHDLKVIEDNAQAFGATYKGKKTGSMGDLGCLSFFPTKNLGGYGDGGMVVTNSEESYARLRSLRAHGELRKYVSREQGWNSRLDEIQAAILRVKLKHLDGWNEARRAHAARYNDLLRGVSGLQVPGVAAWGEHVFHQYTIRVSNRDSLQKNLSAQGIATTVYYPVPIHLQPIYSGLRRQEVENLPKSERAAREVLSLPIFAELKESQICRVCESIRRASHSR